MPPRTCTAVRPLAMPASPASSFAVLAAVVDVAGAVVVEDRRRRVRRAARQLDAHVHVGEQVLDGLERADRHTELVALERVRRRDVERALRDADELRGGEHGAGEAQPLRVLGPADRGRRVGRSAIRERGRQRIERFAGERVGERRRRERLDAVVVDDDDDVALGGVLDDERRRAGEPRRCR